MQTLTTLGVSVGFTNNHKHPSSISCCVSGWQALISTTWILSSWLLRAPMPSENSRCLVCGHRREDGVWSMLGEALKDGHCRGTPALWRGPTSVDADTSQPPSGRVRLPLTLDIFAEPLEHAARDGVSVGQKLLPESWERVQFFFLFFFFFYSLYI